MYFEKTSHFILAGTRDFNDKKYADQLHPVRGKRVWLREYISRLLKSVLRICRVNSNFQLTGSIILAEATSFPAESDSLSSISGLCWKGEQVHCHPQAFPFRIGFGSQVEQTSFGRGISNDVRIIDKELHVVIITRNWLSYGWYNSVMPKKLTHLDDTGRAHMVDVGNKPVTERLAIARGEVLMKKETLDLIRAGAMKKGDVLTVAQIAGIAAAKRTSDLIPLCHPLPITHIDVSLTLG